MTCPLRIRSFMAKYHFYSLTDRQRKQFLPRSAWRHNLALVVALCLAGVTLADDISLPDLRDLSLANWNCLTQREGTPRNPAGASRNRKMNRDFVAVSDKNIPQWDYAEFVKHAKACDAELRNPAHRSNLTVEAEAKLSTLETQLVSVTGWMVLIYPGPPESCNCGSAEFHDWHVELVPKPLDHAPKIGDPTAIICEVTPRTEAALYQAGTRLLKLAGFINQGKSPNIVDRKSTR